LKQRQEKTMSEPRTKSLDFTIPTDEEAMGALGTLIQRSGLPAENQISLRLWFTELLEAAGRTMPVEPAEEDEAA
jgi:hypothetical protein